MHFLVEGQTEEGFVNEVLAPVFAESNIFTDVHRITTGRHRGTMFRGGLVNYEHLARDLVLWMKQYRNDDSWFTTMIDLYGLPGGFPGLAAQSPAQPAERAASLEGALKDDIARRLGGLPVAQRLIPYIQVHAFEALLFVDPGAFLEAFPHGMRAVKTLTAMRAKFPNPEDMNDGQQTAPSKRILSVMPDYHKPVAGLLIAQRIGLAAMRSACPHFDARVTRLLGLTAIP